MAVWATLACGPIQIYHEHANTLAFLHTSWVWAGAPFLKTPDNFPGPKTIWGAQYCPIAIQFLLILKAKF